MGVVNASGSNANVTVSVWRSDGTKLGEKTYPVLAGQAIFVGTVMTNIVGGTPVTDGYLKVVPSAPGAIFVWTSYVDNQSTDQTFVTPIPIN